MPLNIPEAPPASVSSLNAILPHVSSLPGLFDHSPALARGVQSLQNEGVASAVRPLLSIAVYVLGLDVIAGKKELAALKPVLWTHVLSASRDKDEPLVAADTSAETSQFQSLAEGPASVTFWKRFEYLKTVPSVVAGSYDLAELRVPALHIDCFWLRSKAGDHDLIVPFTHHNDLVTAGKDYSAQDFLDAIRPAALHIVSQDNEGGKGGG